MIRSMTSIRDRIGWLDIGIAVAGRRPRDCMHGQRRATRRPPTPPGWAVPFFALIAVPILWRRVSPLAAVAASVAAAGLHVGPLRTPSSAAGSSSRCRPSSSPSPSAPASSATARCSASLWRSASASSAAPSTRPPARTSVMLRRAGRDRGLGRRAGRALARPHGRASSRPARASCARRATSAPGWRSPTTAPACRPSSTACSSGASASSPAGRRRPDAGDPEVAAATLARSRPRAAARSRRCAPMVGVLRDDASPPRSRRSRR